MTLQPYSPTYSRPYRQEPRRYWLPTALQANLLRTCAMHERNTTHATHKNPLHTRVLPVGLSGRPIRAGSACRFACRYACRPVGSRAFSYLTLPQEKKNEMGINLRAEMPATAAWIDSLRAAFGADQINPSIKSGMKGGSAFYASENGHVLGKQDARQGVSLADMVLAPTPSEENAVNSLKNARRGK